MNNATVIIFDEAKFITELLTEFVRGVNSEVQILATQNTDQAIAWVDEHRPCLVLTNAIPSLDIREPESFKENDAGLKLIRHIRKHVDSQISKTWIILFMSRLEEFFPDEMRELIGERANLFIKPFQPEMLNITLQALFRTLLKY